MDYTSPIKIITRSMSTKIDKEIDDAIMRAIAKVGIHVDKEELIKALEYDRDQYQRGFMAGLTEWEWTPGKQETAGAVRGKGFMRRKDMA